MIKISALFQMIEEIKQYALQLGIETKIEEDYIIFSHNGIEYIKIVPKIDGINHDDVESFFYVGKETTSTNRELNACFFDKLLSLRKKIDESAWYSILVMIFTSRSAPYDSLNVIFDLISTNQTNQEHSNKAEKSKKDNIKNYQIEDLLLYIKEKLNIKELINIGNKIYYDNNTDTAVLCMYSKSYFHSKKGPDFWFSYHPKQKEKLSTYDNSYIAFCLVDEKEILIIPIKYLDGKLEYLNTTKKDDGSMYWHIRIDKINNKYLFRVPNKGRDSIQQYAVSNSKTIEREEMSEIENGGDVQVIKINSIRFKTINR